MRIDELKDRGVKGYLRKPFTPESICTTLKQILENRMDNEEVKDLLCDITVSVLESAAFLFVDEEKMDPSGINEIDFRVAHSVQWF